MKFNLLSLLMVFVILPSAHASNDGENVIFVGSGSAEAGPVSTTSNKSPFTVGYLNLSNSRDTIFGFDVSGEGTKLDSTWGRTNSVKQANSFNLIAGKNIGKSENSRYDFGAVIGFRHKTSSCPSSYLGYQCYADTSPKTSYAFNYGLVLTWSYKNLMLGVRATGESKQALVGIRY
jgi:hypothetical protein